MGVADYGRTENANRAFIEERDWGQFHSPRDLEMALSVEVVEIVEHFQWLTDSVVGRS
jgi:dCTP diphosphatase